MRKIDNLKDFLVATRRFVWWQQLTILRASANELRAAGYHVTPGPATRSKDKTINKRAAEPEVVTVKPRTKSAKTAKFGTRSSSYDGSSVIADDNSFDNDSF